MGSFFVPQLRMSKKIPVCSVLEKRGRMGLDAGEEERGAVVARPKSRVVQHFRTRTHCSIMAGARKERAARWWRSPRGLILTLFECLLGENCCVQARWITPTSQFVISALQPLWVCRVNYQTGPCVISSAMKSNLFTEE